MLPRPAGAAVKRVYSDLAIETALALRLVLYQPLRQTEGALRSIADLLGVEIRIPDHATSSRRGGGLTILPKRIERNEPLHLLVDSAGIKICGEGPTRSAASGRAAAGGSFISRSTSTPTRSSPWN
jgi:hypothetical protein